MLDPQTTKMDVDTWAHPPNVFVCLRTRAQLYRMKRMIWLCTTLTFFIFSADLKGGCSGVRQREQDPLHGGFGQEPLQRGWSLLGTGADYQVQSVFILLVLLTVQQAIPLLCFLKVLIVLVNTDAVVKWWLLFTGALLQTPGSTWNLDLVSPPEQCPNLVPATCPQSMNTLCILLGFCSRKGLEVFHLTTKNLPKLY